MLGPVCVGALACHEALDGEGLQAETRMSGMGPGQQINEPKPNILRKVPDPECIILQTSPQLIVARTCQDNSNHRTLDESLSKCQAPYVQTTAAEMISLSGQEMVALEPICPTLQPSKLWLASQQQPLIILLVLKDENAARCVYVAE